jgi:hypothetical protein
MSKRWRDFIRSSNHAAFKAREGWCGDWLAHNAGLDAEQKRTKKKERKMITVYDPSGSQWDVMSGSNSY